MRKIIYGLFLSIGSSYAFADLSGIYVGGGLGYGLQTMSLDGVSNNPGTPTVRAFAGYQLFDWIGVEAGYTYITQSNNLSTVGPVSTTVYDLAFLPGFSIPLTPVTVYGRFGIDGISSNINSAWYNQMFSPLSANFEWGAGIKVNIPATRVFVRAEYTNYGATTNNGNPNLAITPNTFMLNAAYVF
jgi:hypothetical protein